MLPAIPKTFKFKMNKIIPSNQIINGEVVSNNLVRTYFHNGYKLISKEISYSLAYECIKDGIWELV